MANVEDPSEATTPTVPAPYARVKQAIEERALELVGRGEDRLPAEEALSRQLGVSRATLRSALLALQLEGKISRRHGVGTLINRHALGIGANLAEDLPFLEVIERSGGTPAIEIARMEPELLTDALAQRLGLPAGERAMVIDRLFRASGHPVVLSRDHVPQQLLRDGDAGYDAGSSVFAFLRDGTGRCVRYSVARIGAVAATDQVGRLLGVAVGAPLLVLDHLHIDEHDRPVAVTEAFVRSDQLGFAVVRAGRER